MMRAKSDHKIMPSKPLTPEARRALAEAEERRNKTAETKLPKEIDGRTGLEPTRFGDWENKGLISDF